MDTSRFHSAVGVLERGGWAPRRLVRAVAELESVVATCGETSWQAGAKIKVARLALDSVLEAFHQAVDGIAFSLVQEEGTWYTARTRELHQIAEGAAALMTRPPRPPKARVPGERIAGGARC